MNPHPSEPTDGQPATTGPTQHLPPQDPHGQEPFRRDTGDNSFFAWVRQLGIRRSPQRWIGGVAGGIAQRTGLDPTLVRGLVILLSLFGVGVVFYGVAWALLPEPGGRIHLDEAIRGTWSSGMTGALTFSILGFGAPGLTFWAEDGWLNGIFWGLFWIAAIILCVYWATTRSNTRSAGSAAHQQQPYPGSQQAPPPVGGHPGESNTGFNAHTAGSQEHPGTFNAAGYPGPDAPTMPLPAPGGAHAYGTSSRGPEREFGGAYLQFPPPAPKTAKPSTSAPASWSALISGMALLTAGVLLALDYAGIYDFGSPAAVALAGAAVVLGVGIVGLGAAGRSSGIAGGLAVVSLIAALLFGGNYAYRNVVVANDVDWNAGQAGSAEDGYSMAAAGGNLDLRSLAADVKDRDVVVPVSIAAGNLVILVPDNVRVSVVSEMALGNIELENGGSVRSAGGLWVGPQERELNETASGNQIIIHIKGVASNVLVTTNESSLD
ncbi:PspC domain-containing protein [Arthrobacter sp. Sa2CUA1]|uniref:PspC domain-containing protein n=1 Tax=Arthrobacter gallicola TaxID=2762225 RepID=A0ABR8URD7_9MICC|nr:PspC domain-containing protein [Arthrobacter gallicola]MBD7995129.1 PspC domain-containing protein [Arthrobacter gallicola]